MPIQLGSAYGKIALDVSGLLSGVAKGKASILSFSHTATQIGGALKDVGSKLTLGLTLPIAALGAAAIKAASSFEETKNKTKVIFGEMGDDILKWSEDAAQAFGQSETQALNAASNFAIFGKAAGLAGQGLADFAKSNTELASDLASFFDTSPEEAILAIGAAYRGESEPIRKYGVLINEAAIQQQALKMGIIDQLGPLTQQQKILAVNALILEQTKDAQGDFARTSDGLANSTRKMNAEFQKTLRTLGENLLPIALKVVQTLNDLLISFNNLSPGAQKFVIAIGGILFLAGPITSLIGTIVSIVGSIGGFATAISGLGISFAGVGTAITATVIPAIGAVFVALLPILAILAGLLLWVGVVYLAWKNNFLGMRDNINTLIARLKSIFDVFGKIRDGLKLLFEDGSGALLDLAVAFGIPEKAAQEFLSKIWLMIDKFRDLLTRAREYIVDAFTKTDWSQLGKFIAMGIANGLLLGIPGLILAAAKAADAALAQIKKSLGISSPSRKAFELGASTAQGYMLGLRTLDPNAIANMVARPITNSNSQQQVINNHFATGVTLREVRAVVADNNEQLINTIIQSLEGA